jgi:ADP-heptose:LPS heptosyltransferase
MPVLNLAGRTDLSLAAALLMRASVFIGNDSGLGHIAAAVGRPTMTVFGPGRPERYRPWGSKTEVVRAPQADLGRLTSDEVFRRLKGFINSMSRE